MPVARPTLDRAQDFRGAAFGPFVALRPIATSSLATLYVGQRRSARGFVQTITLNVLHPHLAQDRELVAILSAACRAAARIDHPNVCRVFDAGEAHGTCYVAMQYLFGETLGSVLRAGERREGVVRIAPELLAYIVAQACDGLQGAHGARGVPLPIVHGELSPYRLHIGYEGPVHVRDFGMLEAIDRVRLGRGDVWKTRFAYLAPEQMRGDSADPRADLWSLGVILRESLCGRRMFQGKSAAQIMRGVLDEPLPAWPIHVPGPLREVCERALQRDPERRYPSANAMSADLRRFFGDERDMESRLARWMRARFAQRMDAKKALLSELSRQCRMRPGAPAAKDRVAYEEPARATFDDWPALHGDDGNAREAPESSATHSHVRLAALARLPAPPELPRELTIRPPHARAARLVLLLMRHPIAYALTMLLLGVALGCVFVKTYAAPGSAPGASAQLRH